MVAILFIFLTNSKFKRNNPEKSIDTYLHTYFTLLSTIHNSRSEIVVRQCTKKSMLYFIVSIAIHKRYMCLQTFGARQANLLKVKLIYYFYSSF